MAKSSILPEIKAGLSNSRLELVRLSKVQLRTFGFVKSMLQLEAWNSLYWLFRKKKKKTHELARFDRHLDRNFAHRNFYSEIDRS